MKAKTKITMTTPKALLTLGFYTEYQNKILNEYKYENAIKPISCFYEPEAGNHFLRFEDFSFDKSKNPQVTGKLFSIDGLIAHYATQDSFEKLNNLDAVSKVEVRKFIKEINRKNKVTVILTTHDMNDIEALTNRVIVIGRGKKLYDGTLNGIKKKFSNHKKLEILFNRIDRIPKLKNVEIVEKNKNKIVLDVDINYHSISNIIEKFTSLCEIQDVNVIGEDIDNIIVKLYEELNL